MKEFFRMILIEPFQSDWWLEWLMGILMWILTVVVSGLLVWVLIWAIDSSFMPTKEKEGTVTSKYIVPEHMYTTYMLVGKIMVPQTHFIPTSYDVEVSIDGLTDAISIDINSWNGMYINQKVKCKYTNGRIFNSLYIKSFDF